MKPSYEELEQLLAESQRKLAQMAAENAGLKNPDNWLSRSDYGYEASEVALNNGSTDSEALKAGMNAIISRIATPTTDALLAEVRSEVIEWLDAEISAIDPVYRGSPSYEHDAYWMKTEVQDLIEKSRELFATRLRQEDAAKPCPHCGGVGNCSEHGCTATDQMLEQELRKGVQS